jgi:hypothetical protein
MFFSTTSVFKQLNRDSHGLLGFVVVSLTMTTAIFKLELPTES